MIAQEEPSWPDDIRPDACAERCRRSSSCLAKDDWPEEPSGSNLPTSHQWSGPCASSFHVADWGGSLHPKTEHLQTVVPAFRTQAWVLSRVVAIS